MSVHSVGATSTSSNHWPASLSSTPQTFSNKPWNHHWSRWVTNLKHATHIVLSLYRSCCDFLFITIFFYRKMTCATPTSKWSLSKSALNLFKVMFLTLFCVERCVWEEKYKINRTKCFWQFISCYYIYLTANEILPQSQNICRFCFPRNNFDKIYIKNINIYGTILVLLQRSLNLVF